jgi:orotate phosphoribosyltransferase
VNYRSINDLNEDVKAFVHKLPRDLDLIVGIPRSGLLVANLIALYLNLPFTDVDGLRERRIFQSGLRLGKKFGFDKCKKVLVVDDSVFAGKSMKAVKSIIDSANLPYQIYYAAVYATSRYHGEIDLWHELVEPPRFFEWNTSTHDVLTQSCVDLDGVFCRDPTKEENDDGDKYRYFIANVEPIFIPSVEIGWIVTSRLEKYRDLTEEWLKRHGIRYRNLVMMNFPDKEARIASQSYSTFKAEAYKSTGAILFIESSLKQAQEIAKLTGKEVLCVESNRLIRDDRQYRITELENKVVELQDKVSTLRNRILDLQNAHTEKMKELRNSVTFSVGDTLVSAVRSPKGAIALPIRIWRIYKAYISRSRRRLGSTDTATRAAQLMPTEVVQIRDLTASTARKVTPIQEANVLFMPTNGAGLGHVTRLLAIARRLRTHSRVSECVFLTTSDALNIIRREGFIAYHFPSPDLLRGRMKSTGWNSCLADLLAMVMANHEINAFAFDGVSPYPGITEVVAGRKRLIKIWIRRGVREEVEDKVRATEKHFDLVIIPGELGQKGISQDAAGRIIIPPIVFLGREELLGRGEVVKSLGLQPDRKTVFIQLPAGNVRPIETEVEMIMDVLYGFKGIQVVLANSIISKTVFRGLKDVKVIQDYPVSLYYSGFDVTISAAGYNSVAELSYLCMPSILIPRIEAQADDQLARSLTAQEKGMGLVLHPFSARKLSEHLGILLDENRNKEYRKRCLEQSIENGADTAAKLMAGLFFGNA